jgi:hypothetical protein
MKTRVDLEIVVRKWSWNLALLLCAGALLLAPCRRAAAQESTAGPLPAATPSDKPLPPPKPRALIGGKPNLSGTWNLNKDDSDDARKKLEKARNSSGNSGAGGPRPGWGGRGGVWGGGPGGYPHGGGGNGGGGGGGRGQNGGQATFMDDYAQLTILQTASTAKVTAESGHIVAVYPTPVFTPRSSPSGNSPNPPATPDSGVSSGTSTGGSNTGGNAGNNTGSDTAGNSGGATDNSGSPSADSRPARTPPSVDWQGTQLVVVEQGGHGGTTRRTFELSPDGNQLYLTTVIDNPRFKKPVSIRFVYDPAPSGG